MGNLTHHLREGRERGSWDFLPENFEVTLKGADR